MNSLHARITLFPFANAENRSLLWTEEKKWSRKKHTPENNTEHSYIHPKWNGKKLRFDPTRNKQFILYWIFSHTQLKKVIVCAEMEAKRDSRDGAHYLKSTKLAFQFVSLFFLSLVAREGVRGKGTLRIEITENFMVKMSFTQLFHSLVVCYFRESVCACLCVCM